MDLTLYKVTGSGRIVLGDLAAGVEFYSIDKPSAADGAPDGTLILTPVTIVGATKRADSEDPQQ